VVVIAFVTNRKPSGVIRGYQMAEYLGRPLNPPPGAPYDRIVVKVWPSPDDFTPGQRTYVDVLDGFALVDRLKAQPDLGVIAFTPGSHAYLVRELNRQDIVLIPQHHCNFARERRPADREVRTVGFVGAKSSLFGGVDVWRERFRESGFDFVWHLMRPRAAVRREKVLNLYRAIDIQVYWRPHVRFAFARFKDSLKLVNALSFGIPTVARSESHDAYALKGCLVEAGTPQEIIRQCCRLRDDPALYEACGPALVEQAEPWHIDRIAPRYLELEARAV